MRLLLISQLWTPTILSALSALHKEKPERLTLLEVISTSTPVLFPSKIVVEEFSPIIAIDLLMVKCSKYVPAGTCIVSPGSATSIAS
jgi:hypothetical protein